jgi:hypothetical protein
MKYLFFLIFFLSGCNTTNYVGEKHPSFTSYQLNKPLIIAEGPYANYVEVDLQQRLQLGGVQSNSISSILKWSKNSDDAQKLIEKADFESVIYVYVGDQTDVSTFYQSSSQGTATISGGNGFYTGRYSGTTTTIPVNMVSRDMTSFVEVRHCNSLQKNKSFLECDLVWKGTTSRHAQGLAFTGTEQMVDNTVGAILDALKKDKLL